MPKTETLDILSRLVGFPTVSAQSNLDLIDYVEGLLIEAGFEVHRVPDPELPKAGLFARIGGNGPGGVLLSAHSDVVPSDGQVWSRPAFELTREGGRLYGRGTTDMKGFLASMLSLARRAGTAATTRPLMLSISYDEEVGCQGMARMLPAFTQLGWRPQLCIVGEPTSMRPAIGHKGKAAFRAVCRGTTGHSALAPRFVNALYPAGEFLEALRKLQEGFRATGARDAGYDIPYSTVHAGRMQGGSALNIVPDRAEIDFELRYLPGDSLATFKADIDQAAAEITDRWRQIDPAAAVEIIQTNAYPGLHVPPDSSAVVRVAGFAANDKTMKVAFGTEAGYFAGLGIPTIVCGPGDMTGQGHRPDEYLEAAQLAACDGMMDEILSDLR
ncbi:MAG: acetylornithine deacetylase [Rhodobacteraceae bacterium]|nr:acetylornithine deacetylase [Paracoccaceae bacterium]